MGHRVICARDAPEPCMRAGNRRGRVASVIGIDHDYHGFANSLPDRPAKPKVLVEAEAELELDLDLDRLKARTRPLLAAAQHRPLARSLHPSGPLGPPAGARE